MISDKEYEKYQYRLHRSLNGEVERLEREVRRLKQKLKNKPNPPPKKKTGKGKR